MVPRAVRRTDSAPAGLVRVHRADRIDVSGLLPPQMQSDGSLLLDGYVARPGVLVYQNADGTSRRELVTRATLRDSAPSLGRKTLTLEHPDEDVSPDTVAKVGVGDVDGEVVVYDDGYTRVKMAVRRGDAIEAFRAGVQELSPGYACDLDMTPGIDPEFGAYDAVQVRRDYNHVALCTRARGGPTIRARADSADVAIQTSASELPMKTLTLAAPLLLRLGILANKPVRLDADGAPDLASASEALASLEANAPATAAALASVEQMKKDLDVLKATVAAKEAELAKLTGGTPAELEEEVAGAMEGDPMLDAKGEPAPLPEVMPADSAAAAPVRMDAIRRGIQRAMAERAQLHTHCDSLGIPAAERAKLGNKRLRKAILTKADPKARQDGSPEYDRARIDALGDRRDSADPYVGMSNGAWGATRTDSGADRGDAAPVDPINRYRDGFKARHTPAA